MHASESPGDGEGLGVGFGCGLGDGVGFGSGNGVEVAPTGNEFKLNLAKTSAQQFQIENDLPVKPVGFSPNGAVENAQIVFVGYGIVSEELKINDYQNLDVNGKVVLAFDGNPENDVP